MKDLLTARILTKQFVSQTWEMRPDVTTIHFGVIGMTRVFQTPDCATTKLTVVELKMKFFAWVSCVSEWFSIKAF